MSHEHIVRGVRPSWNVDYQCAMYTWDWDDFTCRKCGKVIFA